MLPERECLPIAEQFGAEPLGVSLNDDL